MFMWGSIQTYCLSYFYFTKDQGSIRAGATEPDQNATPKFGIWVLSTQIWCQMGMGYFGSLLQKKVNPKLVILCSGILVVATLLFAINSTSWWQFFIFYGIAFPMSMGVSYYIPIMCAWEWFPEWKASVTGIILAGYGLGGFVFGLITADIVNPENLKPDVEGQYFPVEVANRVPLMFKVCTACYAGLYLIAILTVERNPDYVLYEL